ELENGQRYLDANMAPDAVATLALPADARVFVRTPSAEGEVPAGSSTNLRFEGLHLQERQVVERGSVDASYRRLLFAHPYGPTYYKGFVDSEGGASVRFAEPPDRHAGPSSTGRHRGFAIGMLSIAAASAVASITTGLLAWQAKSDFDGTTL